MLGCMMCLSTAARIVASLSPLTPDISADSNVMQTRYGLMCLPWGPAGRG